MLSPIPALALALALQAPSPEPPDAPAADAPAVPPLFVGPKVLVPPPVRGGAIVAAAHRPLVEALQERFGPRVLDVGAALDALDRTGITASDLKPPPPLTPSGDALRAGPPPPPALARLGEAAGAERAILIDVKVRETTVLVYPGLDGAPAVVVKVPKKKADYLNKKWADAIAAAVERYAKGALEDPAQDFEIGEVMAEGETDAPSDVQAEIAAEEARARARRDAIAAKEQAALEASDPIVMVLVGAGGALRFLDVTGSFAPALAPVENGIVPVVSAFVGVAPLRAIPALRTSPWADALVELSYRRGFATVIDPNASGANAAACPYDDDDVNVRATYRALFADPATPLGAWLPRVGAGAGGGVERVELGCALPVVSTSYPHATGFLRLTQPLVPRTPHGAASLVELDVVAGPRAVFASSLLVDPQADDEVPGGGEASAHLSWSGDFFVVARPVPFLAARAGARVTSTRLDNTAGRLVVDDTRVSLELQLGGSF